jgi:hypothetical protein
MTQRLTDPSYLAFPLRIGSSGANYASRTEHIRGQIEQVLYCIP